MTQIWNLKRTADMTSTWTPSGYSSWNEVTGSDGETQTMAVLDITRKTITKAGLICKSILKQALKQMLISQCKVIHTMPVLTSESPSMSSSQLKMHIWCPRPGRRTAQNLALEIESIIMYNWEIKSYRKALKKNSRTSRSTNAVSQKVLNAV